MAFLVTPILTVRALNAVGVAVPMTYALGTSRGTVTRAPLLLIDLETEEGVTGHAYIWSYLPEAMPAIASVMRRRSGFLSSRGSRSML